MKNCLRCSRFRLLLGTLTAAFAATVLICLFSQYLIRSVDDVFRLLADKTSWLSAVLDSGKNSVLGVPRSDWAAFASVFSSLDRAALAIHALPAFAVLLPGALLTGLLIRNLRKSSIPLRALRVCLAILIALIFLLTALAAALFMTDVNGIRLGRVVLSLIQNFDAIASML